MLSLTRSSFGFGNVLCLVSSSACREIDYFDSESGARKKKAFRQ